MKKGILILFVMFFLIVSAFTIDFSADMSVIEKMVSGCKEEYVYFEELYDMNATNSYAEMVVIPGDVINWETFENDYDVPTAIMHVHVNDYYREKGLTDILIDSIRVSGISYDEEFILDELASFSILTEKTFVQLLNYSCRVKSYENPFVIFIYSNIDNQYDFVINILAEGIQENWKIRKDTRDYMWVRKIIEEIE